MSHKVIQLALEEYDNFIYILFDPHTRAAAVIDPAWYPESIQEVLDEENLHLEAIFITHADHDHINAVAQLMNDQVTLFVHPLEAKRFDCPQDAIFIHDGDEIQLGSSSVKVWHTAGHTAGSCCFQSGYDLITGDTLFVYGAGNVRGETGNAKALFQSLQRLKTLSPNTRLWCGHHYGISETTTLGEQLAGNPFLMIDNEADFVRYREQLAAKTRTTPYAPISPEALQEVLQTP